MYIWSLVTPPSRTLLVSKNAKRSSREKNWIPKTENALVEKKNWTPNGKNRFFVPTFFGD